MRTYKLVENIEKVLHCDNPSKVIAGEYGMATAIAEFTGAGRDNVIRGVDNKVYRNKILITLAEYTTYNKVSVKTAVDVMVALLNTKYKVGHTSFLRNFGVGSVISTDTYNCIEDNYKSYSQTHRYTVDLLKTLNI